MLSAYYQRILFQVSHVLGDQQQIFSSIPLDKINYLLLQLEAVLSVMSMILVELTILILIPLEGVGLDLFWPLHKVFILDLHEHLSYRGIEKKLH